MAFRKLCRISEIFGKWSEIFEKWSKMSLLVCLYYNTWLLLDMIWFLISCPSWRPPNRCPNLRSSDIHTPMIFFYSFAIPHSPVSGLKLAGLSWSRISSDLSFWLSLKTLEWPDWNLISWASVEIRRNSANLPGKISKSLSAAINPKTETKHKLFCPKIRCFSW